MLHKELIDPDTGQPLNIEAGQQGELVLTHLKRQCQPLVRFRTGDIITVEATEACSCERTGMRFRVVGRSDDMVVVRGLNLFPTMVAAVINEMAELSGDYRVVLDQPPPFNQLPVQVELAQGYVISDELSAKVAARLKQNLGANAHVSLLVFGSLPVTEGKTKRVIRNYV